MKIPQPSPTGIGSPDGSPPGSVPPPVSVVVLVAFCLVDVEFKLEVVDIVLIPLDMEKPEEAALPPDLPLTTNEPPPPAPPEELLF